MLPIGYGDGYRRGLSNQAEVLIGGRRYPVAGTISMDNITVDLGADTGSAGRGGDADRRGRRRAHHCAEDLARLLGTINYEITCGISRARAARARRRAA